MAELEQIKERIRELAGRRKNVRFSEISWVVNQLSRNGYPTKAKEWAHGVIFTVGTAEPFNVCTHNRGSSQLKPSYVDAFIDVMTELGLYED